VTTAETNSAELKFLMNPWGAAARLQRRYRTANFFLVASLAIAEVRAI
jgi:hypothetical protein